MKKFGILLIAALMPAAFSCTKDDNKQDDGTLAAPEVTVTMGNSSITAAWTPVSGAEGYRCEVTYVSGGRNVDVLKTDITETTFTVSALRPKTTYTVRVAATKGGKASPNWFSEDKTTSQTSATFEITPYEIYNTTTGHIDYTAKVKSSDNETYYWIAAVTYSNRVDAKLWMEEEISDAVEAGETWETLLEAGYIVKGNSESTFVFTGSDEYMFTAAVLEHVGDQINVVSDVTLSYPFHAENYDAQISHSCAYKDYLGEWTVMPYDRSDWSNGSWSLNDADRFNVTISAKETGRTFNLTRWGSDKNKWSGIPVVLDYAEPDDTKNEHFNISIPQDITTENGINWAYTGWLSLTTVDENGNETVMAYEPYDWDYDKIASANDERGWRQAFRGFMANENKTVIKILANTYKLDGMNVYMQSLWVCGMDADGKYDSNNTAYSLNGNRGGIPNAMYYLVRKDVADGVELPAPDHTAALTSSSASTTGARAKYIRVN